MNGVPAEDAWIAQAAAGSAHAFSQLVLNHQQSIRAFLRRLSGNWAEADDLAQEVFLAAWLNIGRYRRGCSFRSWLFGIAYRKSLANKRGFFRRLRRETRGSDGGNDATVAQQSDAYLDLQRAMAALPLEQRAAVALCLAADWSHAEAAEVLGLPVGTVKSHIQRGRAKLADQLADSYALPVRMSAS